MIYIRKQPCPSQIEQAIKALTDSAEWKDLPEQPNSNQAELIRKEYFDKLDKNTLRKALVEEQHGLCAYCMDKIEANGHKMVLEHWYPLSRSKNKAMDYENLLASCRGGDTDQRSDTNKVFCCDKRKGHATISINPLEETMMRSIRYRSNGIIYVDESYGTKSMKNQLRQDINQTLQLNGKIKQEKISGKNDTDNQEIKVLQDTATQLVKRRKDVYQAEEEILKEGILKGYIDLEWIENEIKTATSAKEWEAFLGVKLYVLRIYLEKLKNKDLLEH